MGPPSMGTTRKFTERQIKTLKPRDRPYKAADGDGLYVYTSLPREASSGGSSTATRARSEGCRSARGRISPWRLPERSPLTPAQSEKYATLTKPAEIAELMQALHASSGDPPTIHCLRILPLVFTRPGELRRTTRTACYWWPASRPAKTRRIKRCVAWGIDPTRS